MDAKVPQSSKKPDNEHRNRKKSLDNTVKLDEQKTEPLSTLEKEKNSFAGQTQTPPLTPQAISPVLTSSTSSTLPITSVSTISAQSFDTSFSHSMSSGNINLSTFIPPPKMRPPSHPTRVSSLNTKNNRSFNVSVVNFSQLIYPSASFVYYQRITFPHLLLAQSKKILEQRKTILNINSLSSLLELQINQNLLREKDKGFSSTLADALTKVKKLCVQPALPESIFSLDSIVTHAVAVNNQVFASTISSDNIYSSTLSVLSTRTADNVPVSTIPFGFGNILSICAAGQYLWVGTTESDILLFELANPRAVPRVLKGHTVGPVFALEANQFVFKSIGSLPPSANETSPPIITRGTLLSSGGDFAIKCWNIESLTCVRSLSLFSAPVHLLASICIGDVLVSSANGVYLLSLIDETYFALSETKNPTKFHSSKYDRSKSLLTPSSSSSSMFDSISDEDGSVGAPNEEFDDQISTCVKRSDSTSYEELQTKHLTTAHGSDESQKLEKKHSPEPSESNDSKQPIESRSQTPSLPNQPSRKSLRSNSYSVPLILPEVESGSIEAVAFARGEIWAANHSNIYCWERNTRNLVMILPISNITCLLGVGPFILSFSVNGIQKWDVRNHVVVETISTESYYKGLFVYENDKMFLWGFLTSGSIIHFPSPYRKHCFVSTVFVSPQFCFVCQRTLWSGKRDGFQCRCCKHICCHTGCLHMIISSLPCDGTAILPPPPKSSSTSTPFLMAFPQSNVKLPPSSIAQSLFQIRARVDPSEIGDWLGTGGNESVAKEWVELLDLNSLDFEMALRKYLRSFSLPGESQKIDRLMQAFASRYYDISKKLHNPPLFVHMDGCYVLAFSCIMLNTSLHNPESSIHFSLDQWLSSNEGLNCESGDEESDSQSRNFDKDFLTHLYYQIKDTPLSFFSMGPSPAMQGYIFRDKKQYYAKILEGKFCLGKKSTSSRLETFDIRTLHITRNETANDCTFYLNGIPYQTRENFGALVWCNTLKAMAKKTTK